MSTLSGSKQNATKLTRLKTWREGSLYEAKCQNKDVLGLVNVLGGWAREKEVKKLSIKNIYAFYFPVSSFLTFYVCVYS